MRSDHCPIRSRWSGRSDSIFLAELSSKRAARIALPDSPPRKPPLECYPWLTTHELPEIAGKIASSANAFSGVFLHHLEALFRSLPAYRTRCVCVHHCVISLFTATHFLVTLRSVREQRVTASSSLPAAREEDTSRADGAGPVADAGCISSLRMFFTPSTRVTTSWACSAFSFESTLPMRVTTPLCVE